ncbi:MAG: tetratricopeptide repeat protein [Tannerellaceae bacterium]|jgi:TolA-binding protein|nr:tetratricopeptide repeat protein [Tannerellaceae bacterium]
MKTIITLLCIALSIGAVYGQRTARFIAPERLFMEGKELFDLHNYSGATDKLADFRTLEGADADLCQEADFLLACCAYKQGLPQAADMMKEYVSAYPDNRHEHEASYYIGALHFGKGEYERALFWLNEADVDMLPPSMQESYTYYLAFSLMQMGDVSKARAYFLRIRQAGKEYKDAAAYYVAYIDYSSERYADALAELTPLKEKPEYREQAQYLITQISFMQGKYDKVIAEGEELLANYPNSDNKAEIYRMVGSSYYHKGNEDKAVDYLTRYANSSNAPIRGDLYILGICHFNREEYSSAAACLSNTVREDDELAQNANFYLGQSYLKLGDKNRARLAFEAAANASFDPQIKEAAMYNYALVIHETAFTGFGESVKVFENFLNLYPQSKYADKVNDYLVEVYLNTRNYQAALTSIEKIARPGTKILEAKQSVLFQLGTQEFANMEMSKALDYFNRAIDMGNYHPDSRIGAFFWRGETNYRLDRFDDAIADYRTYTNNTRQRNTDMYALAWYNIGYSYFRQQKYADALNHFRQYVSLETNHKSEAYADAFNRIGDCYFYNRQLALAEENYNKAATILPSAGDYALFQKGYVLGLGRDYRGKIAALDKMLSSFPNSAYVPDALYERGRSHVMLNNSPQAVESFESLIKRFPQNSQARRAGLQLGLLYYNNNQPRKAVDAYKNVVGNYPGSEEARVALQDLKSVYIELDDIGGYASYVNTIDGAMRLGASEQDSLTYLAAERLFMRNDYDGAGRSFVNYLQSFPNGAFAVQANYHLARVYFAGKNYYDAKRLFNVVIESGDIRYAEDAWARKAEIEYTEKDYAAALESFKRLQSVAEDPGNQSAAKLGIMRCAQQTAEWQDALVAAENILKGSKLSPEVITETRYVRAKAYIGLRQPNRAVADLQELGKDTRTVQGAEAKYLLAQHYFNNNDNARAEKELMNFIDNGTPHSYWLARGFILLADIYIRQNDDFKARQYLNSLRTNYKGNDDIADMIENRLGKLKN